MTAAILKLLLGKIPSGKTGKNLLVSFQSQELSDAMARNMALQNMEDLDKKRDAALHGLHQLEVITLQSGLAVFRPAMSLMVTKDRARFVRQDFAVYEDFFKQKILQVHIMGKYAELGIEAFRKAMVLVTDYFTLPIEDFVELYFPRDKKRLELPTSMESHAKIVSSLRNTEQERIVTFGRSRNMLVLAGPGSGKTRCIVHRIAYLIRVKRIPAKRILALAFNRSAAGLIKQRLKELIGRDAIGVRVYTYHALAMRIMGKSLIGATKKNPVPASAKKEDVFEGILQEAVELLRVEAEEEHGFSSWRDRLLGGLSYILVDEYQDINAVEYDFLSLLAGRSEQRGEDGGQAPTLMAVGDDDQNIYAFTGANVQFIRRFKEEYDAEEFHLTTNFRSVPAIVDASNQVIGANRDRMKTGMNIVSARGGLPHVEGHEVRVIEAEDTRTRLKAALEICARELAEGSVAKESICVLCRTNGEVNSLLQLSRSFKIPMRALRRRQYDLTKTPEFFTIRAFLRDCASEVLSGAQLRVFIDTVIEDSGYRESNIWTHAVRDLLDQYLNETSRRPRPVEEFITYLYDAAREGRGLSRPEPGHVVAATMHAVKGLEFPVVIIPGQPVFGRDMTTEEERRLYYVGMTRAMDRLYCPDSRDCPNPFLRNVSGNGIRLETSGARLTSDDALLLKREWLALELSDVVIDYPGYTNQAPRIQPVLATMEPGDTQGLSLVENGESMYVDFDGLENTARLSDRHVAKLSQKGVSMIAGTKARGLHPSRVMFIASQLWNRPPEKGKRTINPFLQQHLSNAMVPFRSRRSIRGQGIPKTEETPFSRILA